ncbi:MAG: hypothetical protein H0U62_07895 [Actinobacteria bacterium]|nr:hypothetical protein [Actinomycetota bacterium]
MLSKAVLPLGAVVSVLLSVLVLLGVALGQWLLAAAAGCALLSACLLVSLDAWRRARALRAFVRDEIGSLAARQAKAARAATPAAEPADPAPTVTPADVVGTVRLLQAQYVGRLDRLQASVEALVEHTVRCDQDSGVAVSTAADPRPAESAVDSAR